MNETIFKISDIFDEISIASSSDLGNTPKGYIPFIGRTANDNGIQGEVKVEKESIVSGNCITVSMVGTNVSKYHHYKFTCSQNILVLRNKHLNKYNAQYLISILDKYLFTKGYGYGHPVSLKRFRRDYIPLPANSQDNPDYGFMEAYMRQKEQEKLDKYKQFVSKRLAELHDYKEVEPLENKEWGEFFIQDIATIESGRDIYAQERISGNTPYVSSTANNNGIGYFVSNYNKTKEAGCLSVNRNGSVGYSFYHPYEALFSNDCRKLRLNNPSKHIGIFISQQITRQRAKYGYGYKMGTARLKRQKIMLPMNNQNQPDYEYMENYMKRLEYKKIKQYLDTKK